MLRLSTLLRALCLSLICFALTAAAAAQSPVAVRPAVGTAATAATAANSEGPTPAASELDEVRRQLREQREELERMRSTITRQSELIENLRQRVESSSAQPRAVAANSSPNGEISPTDALPAVAPANSGVVTAQPAKEDDRLKSVEAATAKNTETIAKQLGSITFSGDLRLRYESFYGQINALPNAGNPAILGNDLSTRQRFRIRARLNIRGQLGKDFEWGLRLGSGSYADAVSNNQTLTDFYNRKPFSLDNAFVMWKPRQERACEEDERRGLFLQGGKFETPWLRTEMTIDNDLYPEGFSETYSHDFGCVADKTKYGFKDKSGLRTMNFVAWQLPFLERNSSFVRNADGSFSRDESGRAGRDLALYGAQLNTRFDLSPNVRLRLSIADLYFSGTQFISPIQVFGPNLQIPATVVIPASGTTPAQTVTALVLIPRDLLVSGNANLGLSIANNNATNRDGRLASGYNLVDIIGRLDLLHSKRFPVSLLFDYVTNTQTHDFVALGPGGSNRLLENNENNGYWAELQVGRDVESNKRQRGDMTFDYTFMRIEKDAVLTPFNASDIGQQSDVRVHRFSFDYMAYATDAQDVTIGGKADRKARRTVRLTLTGFITQRPNGLLGVFGQTPPGSLNTPTTRLQFDTLFRF